MATAGLPMYDLPELRRATDAWWAGLARAFRREGIKEVPDRLTRSAVTEAIWQSPDLLLSQVCGYNLANFGQRSLTYIATPCYTAPGCTGPLYRSHIVVLATALAQTLSDLRGLRCAINGFSSHSGCNALRGMIAPLAVNGRFFSSITVSGGHVQSLQLLAAGQVDVTAVDCITYALLSRCAPRLIVNTRILTQTVAAPVGPYVTRAGVPEDFVERLRNGLGQAMRDTRLAEVRSELLLDGFHMLTGQDYAQISQTESEVARLGYRELSRDCELPG